MGNPHMHNCPRRAVLWWSRRRRNVRPNWGEGPCRRTRDRHDPQTSGTAVAREGPSKGEGLRKHRSEDLSNGKGPSKRDEDGHSLPNGRQGHGGNATTIFRHLTLALGQPWSKAHQGKDDEGHCPLYRGGAQAANTSRRKRDERLLQGLTAQLRNLTDGEADDDDDDEGDEDEEELLEGISA